MQHSRFVERKLCDYVWTEMRGRGEKRRSMDRVGLLIALRFQGVNGRIRGGCAVVVEMVVFGIRKLGTESSSC